MKKTIIFCKNQVSRHLLILIPLLTLQITSLAQTKVEVNDHDVGSWIGRNWMWVVGIIVLLIILLLFTGRGRKDKTTRQN